MKKTIVLILIFCIPTVSFAAPAFVQSLAGGADCGSVTSCAVSFVSNTTAGNFIIENCRYAASNSRIVTVTDGGSNTYIGAVNSINITSSDPHTLNIQWSANIAGGWKTVTCAISGTALIMRTTASEYSGMAAVTTDARDQVATSSGTGSTPTSGNITPRLDGELVYGGEGNGSGADITAGTDFILDTRVPDSTLARLASEHFTQSPAAAHACTFGASQTNWSAGCISFFAASTSVATSPPPSVDSDFFKMF